MLITTLIVFIVLSNGKRNSAGLLITYVNISPILLGFKRFLVLSR